MLVPELQGTTQDIAKAKCRQAAEIVSGRNVKKKFWMFVKLTPFFFLCSWKALALQKTLVCALKPWMAFQDPTCEQDKSNKCVCPHGPDWLFVVANGSWNRLVTTAWTKCLLDSMTIRHMRFVLLLIVQVQVTNLLFLKASQRGKWYLHAVLPYLVGMPSFSLTDLIKRKWTESFFFGVNSGT